MAKKALNIILLIISIGIILFIANAFYRVFTQTPKDSLSNETPSISTESLTQTQSHQTRVEGVISNDNTSAAYTEDENVLPDNNNLSTTQEMDSTTSGTLLKENPHLRQALPSIPTAPSVTDTVEESTSDVITLDSFPAPIEDNINSRFPTPIESNSSFPAPINP